MRALQEAGERALALCAYHTAASFLTSALELLPPDAEPSAELLFHAGTAFSYVGKEHGELARAVEAFEQAGDAERAAEAAVAASWTSWHSEPADARAWLERATELLEGRPPSRAKALVLAERARMQMINYQYETSIALADEAIQHARTIGDVTIEADAMVTSACTRTMLGDRQSLEMFEQALELVGHRGRVAGRGVHEPGCRMERVRRPPPRRGGREAGIELSERDGDELSAAFMRGNLMGAQFEMGDWDDALAHAETIIETPGLPRYQEPSAHGIRAGIFESRGAVDDAFAEWEIAVERTREMGDPQTLWPKLIGRAAFMRRQGQADEAARALAEVVDALGESESVGDLQEWHVDLVLGLCESDRIADAKGIVRRMPEGRWRDACHATAEGDVRRGRGRSRVDGERAAPGRAPIAGREVARGRREAE